MRGFKVSALQVDGGVAGRGRGCLEEGAEQLVQLEVVKGVLRGESLMLKAQKKAVLLLLHVEPFKEMLVIFQ